MSFSDEIHESIERYVRGKMNLEERVLFEQKVAADSDLQREVEIQLAIHALMIEEGLNDIRQMIRTDYAKAKRNSYLKWIAVISLALLVGTAIVHFAQQTHTSTALPQTKSDTENTVGLTQPEKVEPQISKTERRNDSLKSLNDEPVTFDVSTPQSEKMDAGEKAIAHNSENTPTNKEKTDPDPEVKAIGNACESFHPTFQVVTEKTLRNESTGKIHVKTSDTHLTFSLQAGNGDYTDEFEFLSEGTYTLKVTNDQGCSITKNGITIAATYCASTAAQRFQRSTEEFYEFPFILENISEIQIYDKQNQLVRRISNDEPLKWDGKNSNGVVTETGLHSILVNYNNGEKCYYSLTVFN